MGLSFIKSKKVGIFRFNFSPSGIGISTGIPGLRLGVNSRGKAYVSAGVKGVRYRKTLNPSSKQTNVKQDNQYKNESENDNISQQEKPISLRKRTPFEHLMFVLGVVFLFLIPYASGFIYFAITAFVIFLYRPSEIKREVKEYEDKLSTAIRDFNSAEISSVIKTLTQKYKNDSKEVLKSSFESLFNDIKSDYAISDEEQKLISLYKENLTEQDFSFLQTTVIDKLLYQVLTDNQISKTENDLLLDVLDKLFLTNEKKEEIQHLINEYNKLEEIKANGLSVIEVVDKEINIKDCVYQSDVTLLKNRKQNGVLFYEKEANGVLYLTKKEIFLKSTNNRRISFSSILSTEFKNNVIEVTVTNRQAPIGFIVKDALLFLGIISIMLGKENEYKTKSF